MDTAPRDGRPVFVIFDDGDIKLIKYDGQPGARGWLPRDVLP